MSAVSELRQRYHRNLCKGAIFFKSGTIPSIADVMSPLSIELSKSLMANVGCMMNTSDMSRQVAEKQFEDLTRDFVREAFDIVARAPVSDAAINEHGTIVTAEGQPRLTPLRADISDNPKPILHASISCKLTLRSDRSQNARTEGLNLIRNRKGGTPHIAVVTAEPLPSRIASLALGAGDIDCVYHFALPELTAAAKSIGNEAVTDTLNELIQGNRLRDISDLPFDLAI